MMGFRELRVRYFDGTSRVERTERDDARGRRMLEQAAFERLSWPAVESVTVGLVVRRIANTRGKGRYR